ncbi:hypothetical protein [Spirosoma sp.]|uniref:hypothetical protein n=1 Tax=Spirosoma sp. TaxID=1899569 RepID=UPI00262CFB20|nr:hypothetical protein [Spirosoma sp.]MCX6217693.1 hypothetical protein [Spirosoma sp.]
MKKSKQPLVSRLNHVLTGIRKMTPHQAKLQSSYKMAQEFSAIEQCIRLGILDANGQNTARTQALINDFHVGK